MAQMPRLYSRELVQSVGVVRIPATDFSGLTDLAEGLRAYGAQRDADQKDKDQLLLSAAKNDVRRRAVEFGAANATDPAAFKASYEAYTTQTLTTLPERLKEEAKIEFDRLGIGQFSAITNREAEQGRSFEATTLQTASNDDLNEYLSAAAGGLGTEAEAIQAWQSFVKGMNARVQAGHMPQAQADSLIETADAKGRGLSSLAFIKDTYRTQGYLPAMKELSDWLGNNQTLPLDLRNSLVNQGQEWIREQNGLAEKADADAKKRLHENEDSTAKAGWSLQADGKLKRDWVENNRGNLSLTEYKALTAATRGDADHVDDAATFNELERRMYAGEDISKDAQLAHEGKRLTNSRLDSLLNKNRTFQRTSGPDTPYERARKYAIDMLDPGPMVNDPAARARKANALRMVDDYVAEAPEGKPRTGEEIWQFAEETVKRFALVNWNEVVVTLPTPRFFKGTRSDPNIAATEAELVKARERGDITPEQFNREAQIVDQWRDAIARRDAARKGTK